MMRNNASACWRWTFAVTLATLTVAVSPPLWAQDEVPTARLAEILLKAVSHDRNLKKRSKSGIHIGVVHKGAAKAAAAQAAAFDTAGSDGVKGLSVKATVVEFSSVKKMLEQLESQGLNILFVHPSASSAISSIQQVTRGKKVLSLAGNRQLVEQGFSLGAFMRKGAPRLVVNQKAAKVEGLDLEPAIKLISTFIK
jgi:hypothetical protein